MMLGSVLWRREGLDTGLARESSCQLSSMIRCKDDAMMMGVVVRWMKFSAHAVIIISIIKMLTPIPLY